MDRIVLITGSTDGIGKQTAIDLAQKGYHVLVHGKNREKGIAVVSEIKKLTNNNSVDLLIADLSGQKEIKGFTNNQSLYIIRESFAFLYIEFKHE